MADLPVHSCGVLITDRPTIDGPPDAHSFRLVDGEVLEVSGWARTGRLPEPSRNPPEGTYTSLYAPLPDGLTDRDMTAIHELLKAHAARYHRSDVYLTDNHRHQDELLRWFSTGCQPGTTVGGWGQTISDPAEAPDPELEGAAP